MADALRGKTAIVTGASSGIGKVTARELAIAGADVVMLCRPGEKAEAAHREIAQAAGKDRVEIMTADLSVKDSIHLFVEAYKKQNRRLDILVNNAGGLFPDRQVTVDGFEQTFATNHLAYFLLTNLLLDTIKASAPSRIVCVASGAERWGRIDFDDLQGERHYRGMKAYAQSKLANILFTYELARRLADTGVTANCLHPGLVNSGWGRNSPWFFKLGMLLIRPFMLTPEQGARTSVFLASSPEVEGITGKYYIDCKPATSAPATYDPAIARKLWEISERLTGIA